MKNLKQPSSFGILCSLLSGIWGAWIGFGGYLRLPANQDSFAMYFALGYFIGFAIIGLLVGFVFCFLVWKSIQILLLRLGINSMIVILVASLISLFGVWQLAELVQTKYPGLRASDAKKIGLNR